MSDPASVLVMAPNWLGDTVMAMPAISDVRRRFPSARLVVAARRAVADIFRLYGPQYRAQCGDRMPPSPRHALAAIADGRPAALGGHGSACAHGQEAP